MRSEGSKPSFTIFAMIAATLFSKALGLCRSMLLAWTLGDLPEAVAFAAASKIPGAFFDIFFSAAILGAFMPHYSAAKEESEASAAGFAGAFFGAALAASSLLALLGVIFAPAVISFSAPKISGENALLAARLLRIMFPSAVFTAGVYTLTGVLQARGSFILPAFVSALSNIFIIAYFVLFRARFSLFALAAVFTFSWAVQFLVLALPLAAKKRFPRPKLAPSDPHLRAALKNAPKITAGSWFAPASVLAAAFFCSFVSESAFVLYDYAFGIYAIVSGVAVYGVGNYVFPKLSRLYASKNASLFSSELKKALFTIILMTIPVFCGAEVLAGDAVSLLYARGNFSAEAAKACTLALRTLAFAMPAFSVSEILYRAFCAAGRVKTAALAALVSAAALGSANALSLYLGGGLFGVCASFAVSQWVHALFLLFSAKPFFADEKSGKYAQKTALAALGGTLCFAAMLISRQKLDFFPKLAPSFSNLLKITIVFGMGIVIYLLYVYIMGFFCPEKKKKKRGETA